jgi:hypothetical protein|tara:strand:- start:591 stop:782 length:192 start_codon:yes stop_codon:yes gene_type:complete
MADRIIYKCTRKDKNGNEFISYAPTKDYYQLDTIDVKVINFNANDWTMESLCHALNSDEIEED